MHVTRREPRVSIKPEKTRKVLDPHLSLISFYKSPPTILPNGESSITIQDFEELASARLTALQSIDRLCGLDSYLPPDEKKKSTLHNILSEQCLLISPLHDESTQQEVIIRDQLSHHILRIAFARNLQKKDWLIKQETRLLQFRLSRTGSAGRNKLCPFPEATTEEILALPPYHSNFILHSGSTVLKLPFEEASSLVAKRRVAVHKGIAYVHEADVEVTLLSAFRTNLYQSLLEIAESPIAASLVYQDDRIGSFINCITQLYTSGMAHQKSAASKSGEARLTLANVIEMTERSFPPCMRKLTTVLKKESHLRHFGRMQLRLFFKGCNMTLDDQMELWRSWMAPKLDAEKFKREHAYNIRHSYGQEGKRTNYTPWSCSRIIQSDSVPHPGVGEHHGCPFKTYDSAPLQRLLTEWKVDSKHIDTILELKKGHHHQLACVEYFKANHPGSEGDAVGNHPNTYFTESCSYYAQKNKAKVEEAEGQV